MRDLDLYAQVAQSKNDRKAEQHRRSALKNGADPFVAEILGQDIAVHLPVVPLAGGTQLHLKPVVFQVRICLGKVQNLLSAGRQVFDLLGWCRLGESCDLGALGPDDQESLRSLEDISAVNSLGVMAPLRPTWGLLAKPRLFFVVGLMQTPSQQSRKAVDRVLPLRRDC